ncbi:hypothetical protein BT63DRAFT_171280 [Microthyrium microscopicum]|uniref:Uncharacterized protein n=1 Tax=Microthyrium microscopicum TaxID=703497 RepID=A0A6A6UR53_9PEZI|nr:hypothetical protein BT63DRAFT_171280 [Microthyrium microscopicum]
MASPTSEPTYILHYKDQLLTPYLHSEIFMHRPWPLPATAPPTFDDNLPPTETIQPIDILHFAKTVRKLHLIGHHWLFTCLKRTDGCGCADTDFCNYRIIRNTFPKLTHLEWRYAHPEDGLRSIGLVVVTTDFSNTQRRGIEKVACCVDRRNESWVQCRAARNSRYEDHPLVNGSLGKAYAYWTNQRYATLLDLERAKRISDGYTHEICVDACPGGDGTGCDMDTPVSAERIAAFEAVEEAKIQEARESVGCVMNQMMLSVMPNEETRRGFDEELVRQFKELQRYLDRNGQWGLRRYRTPSGREVQEMIYRGYYHWR